MTIDDDSAEQAFFSRDKFEGPADIGLLDRNILSHFNCSVCILLLKNVRDFICVYMFMIG